MRFLMIFGCVVGVLVWAATCVILVIWGASQEELGPGLRRIAAGLLLVALGLTFEIWYLISIKL